MTIQQLKTTDLTRATIYVDFVAPIAGHTGGRLIGVGRKYARVMFGTGEILPNCRPDQIAKIR